MGIAGQEYMWSSIVRVGFDLMDARLAYAKATNDYEGPVYQMLTALIADVTNLVREKSTEDKVK